MVALPPLWKGVEFQERMVTALKSGRKQLTEVCEEEGERGGSGSN